MRYKGSCHCGQIAFEVEGELDTALSCNCSICARKGALLEYDSPEARHYPADLRMPGYWTPVNTLTLSMAYNADHIRPEDAPKTWEDLLAPKWKGKMAMSDALYSGAALHWYAALKSVYGKAATKDNEFAYAWMPKTDGSYAAYSWMHMFDDMYRGHSVHDGGAKEPGPEGLISFGMAIVHSYQHG